MRKPIQGQKLDFSFVFTIHTFILIFIHDYRIISLHFYDVYRVWPTHLTSRILAGVLLLGDVTFTSSAEGKALHVLS